MKKILVTAYLNRNFGDDLFLKILFERYKNVQWYIYTSDKKYEEMFSKDINLKIKNKLTRELLSILKLDKIYSRYFHALIYIGGSIFMEGVNSKRSYKRWKRYLKIFKGKPKYVIGANFGPFYTEEFKQKYNKIFMQLTDICFREEYSYELFKDLPIVRREPDIVFQLKTKEVNKIKDAVGISVIDLSRRNDLRNYENIYREKMVDITQQFIHNGKKVYFYSFCENQGDLLEINKIISLIDDRYKQYIEVVNYDGDIDAFINKFKAMENIVGTRFHACILSQVFNQGLYPIIYSNKTYNVLKDIGLDANYKYIQHLDELKFNDINKVIDNNKIKDKKIFQKAEKQFDILDKHLFDNLNL